MTPDQSEIEVTMVFLERVKNGEYAPIEMSSLPYVRMKEQTEINEEVYYYGIR
jgi:hypothetical protein